MVIMCWVTGIHHHYLETGRNTHFVTIWRLIQTTHFAASLTDWPASARNDRLTVREKLKTISMFLNGEKKWILYFTFWHKNKKVDAYVRKGRSLVLWNGQEFLHYLKWLHLFHFAVTQNQPLLQNDVFAVIEENREQFDAEIANSGITLDSVRKQARRTRNIIKLTPNFIFLSLKNTDCHSDSFVCILKSINPYCSSKRQN